MNLGKMFGKLAPGMCRLSMNGIAIKTSDGYKRYNVKDNTLVNCADFVFDIGEDMFFLIPTNDVKKGDIILSNGLPVCVIEVKDNLITAFSYEGGTVIQIVPQHHIFFGNTYFYSKIVSIFGDMNKDMKAEQFMPLMMMSEMLKGDGSAAGGKGMMGGGSDFSKMLPMMMFMNGMGSGGFKFPNMFDMFSGSDSSSEKTKKEGE